MFKNFFKRLALGLVEEIKQEVLPLVSEEVVISVQNSLRIEKGETKKKVAIKIILSKLDKYIPLYLKPFKPLIEEKLLFFINEAIEFAVVRRNN